MYEENRLRIILELLSKYDRKQPLNIFLKSFYRQHPQMGSRDRRITSELVYNFYRAGNSLNAFSVEERMAYSSFLCSSQPNALAAYLIKKHSQFSEAGVSLPLSEKILLLSKAQPSFNRDAIFPFADLLSEKINKQKFSESFLIQPKVFIRVRRKFLNEVLKELSGKNIPFESSEENHLSHAFENSTQLTKLQSYERGYFEIQDFSSQQTLSLIRPQPKEYWWDCFAGSGGKSLMMVDEQPLLKIYATDVRESILENLKKRFRKTGFTNYECAVMDILDENKSQLTSISKRNISGVVADVLCSGSGTWARTPEWLSMFQISELEKFQHVQRESIQQVVRVLKKGTPLIYITCSVFKKENEDNIDFFTSNLPLKLEQMNYFEGSSIGADTLFAARLLRT